MTLSLAACGSKAESPADSAADQSTAAPAETDAKTYKVAIIKQLDHASLDEIANAVAAELDQIAADKNVKIEYEVTSGQGDQTILKQLARPGHCRRCGRHHPHRHHRRPDRRPLRRGDQDPGGLRRHLRPGDRQADRHRLCHRHQRRPEYRFHHGYDVRPESRTSQKVGLLYSLSEPNSAKPIADAKAYLDAKGIEYVEQTANTNDEVVAAASALIAAGVDAVFTPTDNVIMAAELAIYEDLAKNGIPHYTGADSFVRNGAYATCGVNYTDLGTQTADLAYTAMTEGMDGMEDYYLMDGGIITVNTDTAAMIGKQADYACFDSMGERGRSHHHQGLNRVKFHAPAPPA